jgi:hypothetical protein
MPRPFDPTPKNAQLSNLVSLDQTTASKSSIQEVKPATGTPSDSRLLAVLCTHPHKASTA